MKKATKKSFKDTTSLIKTWNRFVKWNGLNIGTVRWHHDREWKLIEDNATFEDVEDRSYRPIFECHTQEDMWDYIKENELDIIK